MKNVAQNQEEQKETLDQAFKDLDALMAKASDMVWIVSMENLRYELYYSVGRGLMYDLWFFPNEFGYMFHCNWNRLN